MPDDNTVQEPNLFQNSDTLSESDKDNINLSNADSLETLFSKDSQNGETCHNSTTDIEDTTDTENITKKTESIENNSQTAEKPALVTEDSTVTAGTRFFAFYRCCSETACNESKYARIKWFYLCCFVN